MLKIRLQRVGRKHEPSFRLVLTDSKNSTKSGRYLEILGNYDARRGEKSEFKGDRIIYWVGKGAQLSGTVHNLLIDKKIVSGKKINVLPLKKAILKEVPAEVAPTVEPASANTEEPAIESTPVSEEVVDEVKAEESLPPSEAQSSTEEVLTTKEETPVA